MEKAFSSRRRVHWLLLAGLLFHLVGCGDDAMSKKQQSRLPLRSVDVRFVREDRDRFVAQMRKFGVAFGFDVLVRSMSPDPNDLMFNFSRPDIDLTAANHSDTGAPDLTFAIGFYAKWSQSGPPSENLDVLVHGLKTYLQEIPTATMSDQGVLVR